MGIKKFSYFAGFFLLIVSLSAFPFELEKGITPGMAEWDQLTRADRAAGYVPIAAVRSTQEGIVYVYDGGLGESNYVDSTLIRGWPIIPYLHHLFLFGEYPAAASELAEVKGQTPPAHQAPLSPVNDYSVSYSLSQNGALKKSYGCFAQSPLRYGDVDGDAQSELVLFLDNTIVFFSPQQGSVTFSYHFRLEDEALSNSLIYHEESPMMQGLTPSDPIFFC